MADLIKKIKIKKSDGTFTDYIPIGAEAQNINMQNENSVQANIGNIDLQNDGSVVEQLNKKIYYFNTVAEMKNSTALKNGSYVKTLGFYSINDGGGADYVITDTASNSNLNVYHACQNNLYARTLYRNNRDKINVKQLGANGNWNLVLLSSLFSTLEEAQFVYPCATSLNQSVDWAAIQTAININRGSIFLPYGSYYITDTLVLKDKTSIIGEGWRQTAINLRGSENVSKNIFQLNEVNDICIMELGITSETDPNGDYSSYGEGISLYKSIRNRFEGLFIEHRKNAIHGGLNCFCQNIENCKIQQCVCGVKQDSSNGNLWTVKKCIITHCQDAMYFGEGRNIGIYDCDIELNTNSGITKINEGDIEVIDTYFEKCGDYEISINWGMSVTNMARIAGCSFYLGSMDTNAPRILFHSNKDATITVENCHFKNTNENPSETIYAIAPSNASSKIKIALINNTYINVEPMASMYYFNLISLDYFTGIYSTRERKTCMRELSFTSDVCILDFDSYDYSKTNFPASANRIIKLKKHDKYNLYGKEFKILIRGTDNATGTLKIQAENGSEVIIENPEVANNIENKTQMITIYYAYRDNYDRDRFYITTE